MAAISPSDIFAGYSADSTNITLPLAALPGLTAAEAHATTGDAREVIRIFLETCTAAIEQMQAADRPAFMTVSRNNLVGLTASTVRRGYQVVFEETVGAPATSIRPEA